MPIGFLSQLAIRVAGAWAGPKVINSLGEIRNGIKADLEAETKRQSDPAYIRKVEEERAARQKLESEERKDQLLSLEESRKRSDWLREIDQGKHGYVQPLNPRRNDDLERSWARKLGMSHEVIESIISRRSPYEEPWSRSTWKHIALVNRPIAEVLRQEQSSRRFTYPLMCLLLAIFVLAALTSIGALVYCNFFVQNASLQCWEAFGVMVVCFTIVPALASAVIEDNRSPVE